VSGTLTYSCTTSFDANSYPFTAVIDTDAPSSLGSGLAAPIATTATVTVPESIADLLRGFAATTVDGTSTVTGTVDGVARQSTLTIPKTPVPPAGTTMQVVGTGPSGSITAGAAGTRILLGAGGFAATVTGYSSVGTAVVSATFTCSLQPTTQDLLVDTVAVVPAPTTTKLTVPSSLEYGEAPTVTADVATTGSNAKPAGKATFTFEGKSVTVDVKGGKAKATLAPAAALGSRSVIVTFDPADPNLADSQTSKVVGVVKGSTTTTATAVYRDARHRLVGKALVESVQGTEVAGRVKFVLKRDGVRIRTAKVDLNTFDKAKRVFKNIAKPGQYTLVTRYLGSPTLRRSSGSDKVTV
jgi:hypothetical protein